MIIDQPMNPKWTPKDLEAIAHLAKLTLSKDQVEKRLAEFEDILNYIDVLNEITIEPNLDPQNQKILHMNDDVVKDSLTQEQVFQNATDPQPPFFFIPKVFEGGKS